MVKCRVVCLERILFEVSERRAAQVQTAVAGTLTSGGGVATGGTPGGAGLVMMVCKSRTLC